ncbi:MAG: type II secretion system protein [Clostridia bacterium]
MKNLIKNTKSKLNNNQGFTLVELMVVIVIIAILAAVALPSFMGVMDDAKDSTTTSVTRSLYMVVEVYVNRLSAGTMDSTAFNGVGADTMKAEAGIDVADLTDYSIAVSVDSTQANGYSVIVKGLSESGNLITFDNGVLTIDYDNDGAPVGADSIL